MKRADAVWRIAMDTFYCPDPESAVYAVPSLVEDRAVELIDSLERAPADISGGSLASSVCMREVRIQIIQGVLDAFAGYADEEVKVITVIKKTWAVTPDQLMTKTAASIKNQFVSDLKSSGIASLPGPLVAFLHGEYEPTSGLYILHWHALATAEKADALHRLTGSRSRWKGYTTTHTGAVPIRVDKVEDRVRQVSYLLKAFWPQKKVRDGVRDKRGVRVDEPYHTLYLVWLDRQRLKDITIMNGVWSRRKGGTEAMKRLYFKVFG